LGTLQGLVDGSSGPSREKILAEIAARRARVPEFQFIKEEAQRRGLRVWLFGGTAAGYSHYVKWDLLRELGDTHFQPNRFDYDYTNIYRSTQDLDIVVNGSQLEAQSFEAALKNRFPHFLGTKAAGWEVRSIKDSHGDKGGLLGDFGFMNQHTDSNSTGMVELTDPPHGELVVRDIRDFENNKDPAFLKDLDEGNLTFYHSARHEETPRFKSGQNPPIFSVVRALTKAFQYDLKIGEKDLAILQKEINQFDPKKDLASQDAARWIEKNGKKLFQHAVDLEYAWNTLEKLGLRQKLISIKNDSNKQGSLAWWMSKEPLRGSPVGQGNGRTAESLGLKTVAHETADFQAYESITRSHTGAPNVFVSRGNSVGEAAAFGDGFYSSVGRKGAKGTGITIRFDVNPKAREGVDFKIASHAKDAEITDGKFIVWKNKNAIRVIPESLEMTPVEYFEYLAAGGNGIKQGDEALIWKLKRRIDRSVSLGQVTQQELDKIRSIVLDSAKSNAPARDFIIRDWLQVEGARLKKKPEVVEAWREAFTGKGAQVDPAGFLTDLPRLFEGTDLIPFVTQRLFPAMAGQLKSDVGNRALEHALFSENTSLREAGTKLLLERGSKQSTPFLRALKNIMTQGGDPKVWLRSSARSPEVIQEKAAYLALHPELRQVLPEAELHAIQPAFEKLSSQSVFEKLANGQLPKGAKPESFEFVSFDFPEGGKQVMLGVSPGDPNHNPNRARPFDVLFTKPFEIQATPVTQLQWALVMEENPSHFKTGGQVIKINGKEIEANLNRPVEGVTIEEIQKFIQKLNLSDPHYKYRLPNEAEWEYAARAGTDTRYSFGNSETDLDIHGWSVENSGGRTHDVASLLPNANGLYDVHGNVRELVVEEFQNLSHFRRLIVNLSYNIAASRINGISRGGSWQLVPGLLESKWSGIALWHNREPDIGFRLVRTPK
jgi:formylglycine-generating enzyme required for sulfatase activity